MENENCQTNLRNDFSFIYINLDANVDAMWYLLLFTSFLYIFILTAMGTCCANYAFGLPPK